MEDWRELRNELIAAKEEQLRKEYEANPLNPCMDESFKRSIMRDMNTEDSFASHLEMNEYAYIKDGILTDKIVDKYLDFFIRNRIPYFLDAVVTKKEARFAYNRAVEELNSGMFESTEKPIDDKSIYRTRCRNVRISIGNWLRNVREEHEYDISYVAQQTGINAGTISRIEAGRANVEIDTLSILTQFYNTTVYIY